MFKPIHGQIASFAILNAVIAAILTHKEFDSFLNMTEKIMEEEELHDD